MTAFLAAKDDERDYGKKIVKTYSIQGIYLC